MPIFNDKHNEQTDYLSDYLRESEEKRKEVFAEMLYKLEHYGECRSVYHRLAWVLFNNSLGELEQ